MAEEEEKTEATEEEPKADTPEETPEAETPGAPEDEAEAAAEPEPGAEAEEPAAEPEPAEEPAAEAPPAAAPAAAEEPSETLSPKEIRRRKRSAHTGEAGPQLSSEERIQRREEGRRRKAAERRRYRSGRGAARKAALGSREGTPAAEREPGNPKVRQGTVVSNKMDKTITVRVESARRHPAYEKVIRSSKMYHAHDEGNEAGPGDTVRLVETRPMSKTKHWRLTEILERAK
jgi:small subunit ribosomal protein S17